MTKCCYQIAKLTKDPMRKVEYFHRTIDRALQNRETDLHIIDYYIGLADAYEEQNEYNLAIDNYKNAMEYSTKYDDNIMFCYYMSSKLYGKMCQTTFEIEYGRKLIEMDMKSDLVSSEHVAATFERITINGDRSSAIELFEKSIVPWLQAKNRGRCKWIKVVKALVRYYLIKDDKKAASKWCEKAIQLFVRNQELL